MKRLTAVMICLMLIFSASMVSASVIPDIGNKENCVVDMADVIDQETEDYLSALNKRLYDETGASIVIATVDFTGSMSVSEYAYEAFNKWQIGDKDKDNGLLLLMSIGQEDYFAAHGTGIERDLTASELDSMLYEYLEADFAAERYSEGAESFYLAAYGWFADFYDVNLSTSVSGNTDSSETSTKPYQELMEDMDSGFSVGKLVLWGLLILMVIIIIASVAGNKNAPKKTYRPRTHTRRGPHTTTYRRPASTRTVSRPARTRSVRNTSSRRTTGNTTRSTSGRTTRSATGSSSSSRSTSSRSSSGRSGGFGGGSSRGGGAGRRK